MAVTHAMLLAAGKGERLMPMTLNTPKPLVTVADKPMVERVLELLAKAGIKRVHMNLHHLAEQIPAALGRGEQWGLYICYHNERKELLGTGGGLVNVCTDCPDLVDNNFVMINSDILIDIDLKAVINHHEQHKPVATLVVRDDPRAAEYGIIGTDDDGRIRRLLDVENGETTHEFMFTGVQVLSPTILDFVPNKKTFPITDPYKQLLIADEDVRAFIHKGYWCDLGTPDRLMQAENDLKAGKVG